MTIYEHRDSITAISGAVASLSLKVPGGLLRDVLIRANTATTLFRANLQDSNSVVRQDYAFHRGEIHDTAITLPIQGQWSVNIANASADDTFQVVLGIQES